MFLPLSSVAGQRGTIAVKLGFMHHEHLCVLAWTGTVVSEWPRPTRLLLTSSCDPPLLFTYVQVNTGVLYFLDYVEDIHIMVVLSVLVSILNPNPMYLPLLRSPRWFFSG